MKKDIFKLQGSETTNAQYFILKCKLPNHEDKSLNLPTIEKIKAQMKEGWVEVLPFACRKKKDFEIFSVKLNGENGNTHIFMRATKFEATKDTLLSIIPKYLLDGCLCGFLCCDCKSFLQEVTNTILTQNIDISDLKHLDVLSENAE